MITSFPTDKKRGKRIHIGNLFKNETDKKAETKKIWVSYGTNVRIESHILIFYL